jgi:uncharacterized CHY-type Zn-finger protein
MMGGAGELNGHMTQLHQRCDQDMARKQVVALRSSALSNYMASYCSCFKCTGSLTREVEPVDRAQEYPRLHAAAAYPYEGSRYMFRASQA